MIEYIFPILILTIMIIGGVWAYFYEKKIWNNGICRQTGDKWIFFDIDSQGGRGYKSGDYYCWISYPVDKRGDCYV